MPVKIEKSITIKETPEVIFDLTQNYERRLEWDTFLKKAELINAKTPEKGVKSWCVSKHGLGMETEYVSFNRPKVTTVTQSKTSLLFQSFSGSWRFETLNTTTSTVVFTYSFVLNVPFNLFRSIIKKVLAKNVDQRLRDLKTTLETNPNIKPDFKGIIQLLERVKAHINEEANFNFTEFETAEELIRKIETDQERLAAQDSSVLKGIQLNFAPTGTYQEIAINNGWERDYLNLADEFERICEFQSHKG